MTRSRQLWIPVGGLELEGELEIPTQATGLVTFIHGGGNGCHSTCNQYVAQLLREQGLGTLLLDLLTREESLDELSRRNVPFDICLLTGRLVEATRWVAGQPELQRYRLGYFGDCTGAAAAFAAAALLGESIEAVVSRGGRPDLADAALDEVRCPTRLIVGDCDTHILEVNQAAFDRLRCEKELKSLPGATHLIQEVGGLDEVARLAAEWFELRLGVR